MSNRRNMSIRSAWHLWLSAALVVPPLLFVAGCFGLYAYGARFVPASLSASTERAPDLIRQQFLAIGAGNATRMTKLNPVTYWLELADDMYHAPAQPPPERRLLYQATRLAQHKHVRSKRKTDWHLSGIAYAVKISRQWTFDQTVDTLLAESWYGQDVIGLTQASAHFFGVAPDALRPQESLALIALLRSPSMFDPYCARQRFDQRYASAVERINEHGPEWSSNAALTRLRPHECQRH
jgi:enamine deaminase RidA (YjgF/YER057c/UK114 family)